MTPRSILVLNAGSSTLKAGVLTEGTETSVANLTVPLRGVDGAADAVRQALQDIASRISLDRLDAVGHRVVHGGSSFTRTTTIDDGVLRTIRELSWLAPLHNPVAAAVIDQARALLPDVPHAAAFDTAFHSTLDEPAYVYALPHEWYAEWGYRRYGFHGLSVAWAAERAKALLGRDGLGLVVAHLGAGCSVTAVWHGRSVSTSMGMTPLEGVVMGTRAGSIDPGILLALVRDHGFDAPALDETLEHRSGLLGLSGVSADMKELLAAAATNERAALAIAVFERSIAAGIGAAATALPRLDAVVFTGGIGEHASSVRAGIVRRLRVLGTGELSDAAPGVGDALRSSSGVAIAVIAAREDVVIARDVSALLAKPR